MNKVIKNFSELSTEEIYNILKLRSEVFVVEQNCVYQDIDEKDQKAVHLFLEKNNEIIAYTRIFKKGDSKIPALEFPTIILEFLSIVRKYSNLKELITLKLSLFLNDFL